MSEEYQTIPMDITVLVLAGGRGTRMGGRDKGLLPLAGKPLIEHVIGRIKAQSGRIIISANRNLEEYATYGYPVIQDSIHDFPGPLAGILAGLDACDTRFLLTLPVDAPLISGNFLARMKACAERYSVAACVAEQHGQLEPLFCLLDCGLRNSLRDFLEQGQRSARDWLKQVGARSIDCSDVPDQFINLNCPEDLDKINDDTMRGK